VRETVTGALLLVVRSRAGEEHVLEWTPAQVRTAAVPPAARPPRARLTPTTPPVGFTRAGQPMSAKQMAVRARWNNAARAHVPRTTTEQPTEPSIFS
jgi:hypothetical protein